MVSTASSAARLAVVLLTILWAHNASASDGPLATAVPTPEGPVIEIREDPGVRLFDARAVGDSVVLAAHRWDSHAARYELVRIELDSDGNALGEALVIASDSCPFAVPLAVGPLGEMLVSCHAVLGVPHDWWLIYVDRSGETVSPAILLEGGDGGLREGTPHPTAVIDADGVALVVWAEGWPAPGGPPFSHVRATAYGAWLGPLGSSVGTPFPIATEERRDQPAGVVFAGLGAVTGDDSGGVVHWTTLGEIEPLVRLRRYATSGEPLGPIRTIAENRWLASLLPLSDGGILATLLWWDPNLLLWQAELVRFDADLAATEVHGSAADPSRYSWDLLPLGADRAFLVPRLLDPSPLVGQPYSIAAGLVATDVAISQSAGPVLDLRSVSWNQNQHLVVWSELGHAPEGEPFRLSRLRARRMSPTCRPSSSTACLHGGRFRVEVSFAGAATTSATTSAAATVLSHESSTFSFFHAERPDLAVKVLDGSLVNEHFWLFWGSLTHAEWTLAVTDLEHPVQKRIVKPLGTFGAGARTDAFPLEIERVAGPSSISVPDLPPPASELELGLPGDCLPSPQVVCIDGRYRVSAELDHPSSGLTAATATPLGTGGVAFSLVREDNVELVIKLIDASQVTGSLWVFGGALTNLGLVIEVLDTETGWLRRYRSPPGSLASFGDIVALPLHE